MVGKAGLIVVIGFSIIIGFMSLNMSKLGRKAVNNMSSYNDATLSHNLASAGANIGLARFYADTSWRGDTTQILNGPHFYGQLRYAASLASIPGTIKLQSISTYTSPMYPTAETLNDTVIVYLDMSGTSTFSKFAWMTNNENSVNWTTADTVWGLVHSNGTLYVNGKPAFMQKVTTSKAFNVKPGTSPNNAIFKNGYETGVATHDFPNNLARMDSAASLSGHPYGKKYTDSIYVTLYPGTSANGDGKIAIRKNSPTGSLLDSLQLSDTTFNGVIASTKSIHVKGKIDGVLSIAALNTNIWIDDTVRYEKNPLTTSSDDLLGIVAEKDVIVTDNVANNTNCSIDGCIFTRSGSFRAQNYDNSSPVHTNPLYGTLTVLGSIVQNTRGPVGTISGSTLATGFSKRYRFDDRLTETFKPPAFPEYLTKTYSITNWWESMRVPNMRE